MFITPNDVDSRNHGRPRANAPRLPRYGDGAIAGCALHIAAHEHRHGPHTSPLRPCQSAIRRAPTRSRGTSDGHDMSKRRLNDESGFWPVSSSLSRKLDPPWLQCHPCRISYQYKLTEDRASTSAPQATNSSKASLCSCSAATISAVKPSCDAAGPQQPQPPHNDAEATSREPPSGNQHAMTPPPSPTRFAARP